VIFEQVAVGPLQCNCYILGCEETREALVIDPGDEVELILPLIEKHGLSVRYLLSTHAHIDHVGDLETMKEKTGAEALLHERDLVLYRNLPVQASWMGVSTPPITEIDNFVHQGDRISFGRHSGEVLFTPGHTPGSMSFRLEGSPILFSGDTLFPGGPGATGFEGGDFATIIASIEQRMFSPLSADTVVLPGHGDQTTIGTEAPRLQEWIDRGW